MGDERFTGVSYVADHQESDAARDNNPCHESARVGAGSADDGGEVVYVLIIEQLGFDGFDAASLR